MNRFFRFVHTVVGRLFLVLHPVKVEGMERLPRHGVLLCPNHSSNWDPVLLVASLPVDYRLHVMAKNQLFKNPILGWIMTKLGAFPVDRGGSDLAAVKTAIQSIKSGDNLMVFPEGTRVEREGDVRAKGGAAMIAVRTGAILVPVFVDGKKRLFRRTRLIFGEPYYPTISGRHGTADELQEIADTVLKKAYDLGREPMCRK